MLENEKSPTVGTITALGLAGRTMAKSSHRLCRTAGESLVVVDAHSKWPDVAVMKSTSSEKTVEALRFIFSRFGLPQQLVSDNSPQLVSEEFETFMQENGVQHIRSAPYHPASNGLAERFVKTIKQALKASKSTVSQPTTQCISVVIQEHTLCHN